VSGVQGAVIGCIVVSGLITRDVHLGERICTHLHGPRDFISLNALDLASLPFDVHLGALSDAEVAVLDDRLLAAGQRWPRIVGRLFDMATGQLGRQSADQAISQLPRVEDRLLALFWHLADRWGVRQRDGVAVGLPLTHEALGRLIGARRPTVSLGLRQLAEEGALRRDGELWVLSVESIGVVREGTPRHRPPLTRRATPAEGRMPASPMGDPAVRALLRERLASLRIDLDARTVRTRQTIEASQSIRAQVRQGRASRTAVGGAVPGPPA
jgi:CRP-like cAMP-binding protein